MNKENKIDDQLFYFVFGISTKDTDENKKIKCVEKAYFDFCRTISYKKGITPKEKNCYKKQIYRCIIELLENYPLIKLRRFESFDEWHKEAIYKIIRISKGKYKLFEGSKFLTVGQAQKWLNMSIKYMEMMGLLNDNIERELIHIPIDNYIIDAAKKLDRISELYSVVGLGIEPNFRVAWSRINNYKEYLKYQKKYERS